MLETGPSLSESGSPTLDLNDARLQPLTLSGFASPVIYVLPSPRKKAFVLLWNRRRL